MRATPLTRRIGHPLQLAVIAATTMLCACAGSQVLHEKPTAPLAQPERHIYVTSGDLDQACYQDLGQLTFNESYAESVVKSADSMAQHLRQLALEKYPADADAVIHVEEKQNEGGTAVEVVGEAVHLVNHETVTCAARGLPEIIDVGSAAAAGGIVGTVIGGLSQSGGSVYGAQAGGAMGATAGAGMAIAKDQQQKQAVETSIADRLEQQHKEIAELYQQLAKLIGQECDNEELSEKDCEQRIVAVQQEIAKADEPRPTPVSSSKPEAAAPSNQATEFGVLNRIQEQQEIINKLRQQIAQIKDTAGN